MKLKEPLEKITRNLSEAYHWIDKRFYWKEAGIAFLTVSGPLALYLGFKDAFIYEKLNLISKIYGVGATSTVVIYGLEKFRKDFFTFLDVVRYAKEQKNSLDSDKKE